MYIGGLSKFISTMSPSQTKCLKNTETPRISRLMNIRGITLPDDEKMVSSNASYQVTSTRYNSGRGEVREKEKIPSL